MRTLKFLLQKEFRQIFRDKTIIAIILVMPTIQLLILPLAANYEIKNINLSITDHDRSAYSAQLISKITASGYFKLTGYNNSYYESLENIETEKADLTLEIPSNFERNLIREEEQKVFLAVNAINGVKANLGGAYLSTIIRNYNQDLRMELIPQSRNNPLPVIEMTNSNWYNTLLNYNIFMVPGILAILVTMIAGFLSALNIVREKEMGTIEQINVTPIKKAHFILGKLIPFWIMGLIVFTIGLTLSRVIYGIIPLGSIPLLYGFVAIYLLAVLGFGLLVSTFCDTQQQAMFIAFFFVMIFVLMGGLFTSIDSMPEWAKTVSRFNPMRYLIEVMRMVILKGSNFKDIQFHFLIIAIFAVVLNAWALWNYRKTS